MSSERFTKNVIADFICNHILTYPTPVSLTYAWSFGSLAGICLLIQMLSGVLLAMHYIPHMDFAFNSIEFIMRDVTYGWLARYMHANGASMFFIVVYAHLLRGIYYGSYMKPRGLLWASGVVLLILMMGTAFTGYVLPWGQMSFWGATVITHMVTIVPRHGHDILEWFWGGYTIKNPTLQRIYVIHFVLPFVIAGVTVIHLALLHQHGSTSPIGSDEGEDDVPFYPYFFSKDLFAFFVFLFVFGVFVFYFPNTLNHPDNYIEADPMETPRGLVPEWYFLPFYAILRCIPQKTLGILGMGFSVSILFLLPLLNTSEIRNTTFRPFFWLFFWIFVAVCCLLVFIGQAGLRDLYIAIGQVFTLYYFTFFLFIIPIVGYVEKTVSHREISLAEARNNAVRDMMRKIH